MDACNQLQNKGATMRFTLLAFVLMQVCACAAWATEPITPIPASLDVDPAQAALGQALFFDVRLSVDNSTSCASCHDLGSKFGADLRPVSAGVGGQNGTRNSPTVINAALNFKQFWDGRADTLAEQAAGPVTNPVEMAMPDWESVVSKLNGIAEYRDQFQQVFGGPVSAAAVQQAIAEYEKTLLAPNAPFDRFLQGDDSAITEQQKKGYTLFKAYGCVACHQGANVGGNMFQKFGAMKDINLLPGNRQVDLGRFEVTGNEWEKNVFKVPSLRLATKTPPYFHDGSVATLEEAVDIMIEFQLDRRVPEADRDAIIAFLESLVGDMPEVKS
ncbi:MAG: hypothetical protein Tsb002_18910 [Wenzhouxiangellaceae bacterium]